MTEKKARNGMSEIDKAALKAYLSEQSNARPCIDWPCVVVWAAGLVLGVAAWAYILGLVFAALIP